MWNAAQVARLPAAAAVLQSIAAAGVPYTLYDTVRVEPSDKRCGGGGHWLGGAWSDQTCSFKDAIAVAKRGQYDVYVAVGGGSVMDTCKAANLYASHPDADFLDFVNAPIGKGRPVTGPLKPLIAGAARGSAMRVARGSSPAGGWRGRRGQCPRRRGQAARRLGRPSLTIRSCGRKRASRRARSSQRSASSTRTIPRPCRALCVPRRA
jgi:hypothetical protein